MREGAPGREHPGTVFVAERIQASTRIEVGSILRVRGWVFARLGALRLHCVACSDLFAVEVADAVGFVELAKNVCFDRFSQLRNPRERLQHIQTRQKILPIKNTRGRRRRVRRVSIMRHPGRGGESFKHACERGLPAFRTGEEKVEYVRAGGDRIKPFSAGRFASRVGCVRGSVVECWRTHRFPPSP